MVDVSQYTGLITSEHADKPKFTAMVSAVAQCFVDQQNALGNFIPSFDLDEAVGAQLDTLGAWVGIGRRVRTPLTGVYFSFDIAGVGFDQGVWQGPFDPSTGITVLDDDTYRLLIRAKIGANHWDGTMASSAAILNLIFQGGTTPRHLTATNELFATGDGSTGAFQLTVGGIPVYSNINVASIYRNDWQGSVLLSTLPRMNLALNSSSPASWTLTAVSAGAAIAAPDGTAGAFLYAVPSTSSVSHYVRTPAAVPASTQVTISFFAKAGGSTKVIPETTALGMTGGGNRTFDLSAGTVGTGGGSAVIAPVPGQPGVYRCAVTFTTGAGPYTNGPALFIQNYGAFAGDGVSGIYVWGMQVEVGGSTTPYIATGSSAATVTDYTIGPTGLVAMGQKPVSGAQLTWNGTGDAYPGGTQVFIEDHQDMSISFGVAGKLPSALFLALLSGGYVPIKPEGVHVRDYVTTSVDGSPIFGFDMMGPYVAGFDVGTWGTPLH